MEVHLLCAGAELQDHIKVCHQLFGSSGAAGIIAGGLDAAGEGLGGISVESTDIITLPAMQCHGDILKFCNGGIGVDAKGCVFSFCFCVGHII